MEGITRLRSHWEQVRDSERCASASMCIPEYVFSPDEHVEFAVALVRIDTNSDALAHKHGCFSLKGAGRAERSRAVTA